MTADHLTERQTNSGYTVLGQHPLTDSSSGVYSRSTATSWTAQNAASKIQLPRCGLVGTYLIDLTTAKTLRVVDDNSAFSAGTYGITLECVASTTTTGYNFFGGPWGRTICVVWGAYGYNITITLYPVNDAIGDTTGRAIISTSDVGGTRISSRTVHSRPVISDGLPHHLALTHAATGTSNVIKLYVDGVNTETVTTTGALADLSANTLQVGVDDYFTGFDGSVSHLCLTQDVLSTDEIEARAQLVNGVSGPVLTDQGAVMAWDSSRNAWVPTTTGYATFDWHPASAGWYPVRPPS